MSAAVSRKERLGERSRSLRFLPFAGLRWISSRSTAVSRIAASRMRVMLIVRALSGLSAASFAAM